MMYVGITLKKNGRIAAAIRTSISINATDETIKSIQIKIALGGLIIAVFAAMLGLLVCLPLLPKINTLFILY